MYRGNRLRAADFHSIAVGQKDPRRAHEQTIVVGTNQSAGHDCHRLALWLGGCPRRPVSLLRDEVQRRPSRLGFAIQRSDTNNRPGCLGWHLYPTCSRMLVLELRKPRCNRLLGRLPESVRRSHFLDRSQRQSGVHSHASLARVIDLDWLQVGLERDLCHAMGLDSLDAIHAYLSWLRSRPRPQMPHPGNGLTVAPPDIRSVLERWIVGVPFVCCRPGALSLPVGVRREWHEITVRSHDRDRERWRFGDCCDDRDEQRDKPPSVSTHDG
jgi:hypothetical protein